MVILLERFYRVINRTWEGRDSFIPPGIVGQRNTGVLLKKYLRFWVEILPIRTHPYKGSVVGERGVCHDESCVSALWKRKKGLRTRRNLGREKKIQCPMSGLW